MIDKKATKKDKLGMNAPQYCDIILKPHLATFIKDVVTFDEEYQAVVDGQPAHTSTKAVFYRLQQGIRKITLCGNSPDLNPIENVWYTLKRWLKRSWRNPKRRPHRVGELIEAAQEEWELINWDHMNNFIDSLLARIAMVIKRHGGHTRW